MYVISIFRIFLFCDVLYRSTFLHSTFLESPAMHRFQQYVIFASLVICDTLYHLFHALQEVLLVLDGTTGLNMLQQAREFNDVILRPLFFILKLSDLFM